MPLNHLKDFDQYILDSMESWNCPGAAVAVIKGDDLLHQGAYGLRDISDQLPMTEDTRFAMASVTKSFTAMSVALLVDEGKLEWDKPVRNYIPEFILDDPYITHNVTVRDMLSHRTGLPRHDFSAWRLELPVAEFIKRMKHLKFSSSFREKFQYNNLMYYASAYLVEKVSGKRWEDFVQDRIFSPLGMDASNFSPEPPQKSQINAKGYRVDRDDNGIAKGLIHLPDQPYTKLSPEAAGGLYSTLADMIKWLQNHVNNGRIGEFQLVSPNNLKQMHLPQMIVPVGGAKEALLGNSIFTYGMGWFIDPYDGYTLIHHGGNVEGFSLIVGFVPQKKIGVIALTNVAGLPLRDVLLYEGIDRALELPERDWNAKFHNTFDPIIASQSKSIQTAAEERYEDAPMTHSLKDYLGTYEADGYQDFSVKREDESLQACFAGSMEWSGFRHYHYNVFEWNIPNSDIWLKIRFMVNDSGDVASISIPIEPTVENVTFTRKQPELTDEILSSLIGEYDSPVDGFSFGITVQDKKVYAAITSFPPELAKPYKQDEHMVGFRILNRSRLDFIYEKGIISHVEFKSPYATYELHRRA